MRYKFLLWFTSTYSAFMIFEELAPENFLLGFITEPVLSSIEIVGALIIFALVKALRINGR